MKTAKYGLIVIFSLSILFHLFVISGIVDYHLVWGGKLKSRVDMLRFEGISLGLNALFLFLILIRVNLLKMNVPRMLMQVLLYLMLGVFGLNTLGNLMSENIYEKIIFTPITALIVVFLLTLLRKKTKHKD